MFFIKPPIKGAFSKCKIFIRCFSVNKCSRMSEKKEVLTTVSPLV